MDVRQCETLVLGAGTAGCVVAARLAAHGREGPVPVYRVAEAALNPVQRAYQEACQAVGYARLADINDGRGAPGIGILPKNMSEGVRATSAFAYLDGARERLAVLADHQV